MVLSENEARELAVHEAGHAVVMHHLGFDIGFIQFGGLRSFVYYEPPISWEKDPREIPEDTRFKIMTGCVSGFCAVHKFNPRFTTSNARNIFNFHDDLANVKTLSLDDRTASNRAIKLSEKILGEHWPEVKAVAQALLNAIPANHAGEGVYLQGAQIADLLGWETKPGESGK